MTYAEQAPAKGNTRRPAHP